MIRIGRYAPLGIQPFNCRMTAVELRHHQVRQDKIFVASRYVTAARANFSLLGPASLYPGALLQNRGK
jgi:hypothetical protein